MPTVQVAGAQVRFRHEDGPHTRRTPVVLLHMAGGGCSTFGPVASLLGRVGPVVAPDFPGHGQSAPVDLAPLAVPRRGNVHAHLLGLAGWTWALLDALGMERVILGGHSMGGMVALCAALAQPQRVAGLAMLCTSARLTLPAAMRDMLQTDLHGFAAGLLGAALPRGGGGNTAGAGGTAIFPQAPLETVKLDFDAVDGVDLLEAVTPLRGTPAVVVAGEMDVLTPPSHAQALAQALGTAALVRVPDGGHLLPREQPRLVAQAIQRLWEG